MTKPIAIVVLCAGFAFAGPRALTSQQPQSSEAAPSDPAAGAPVYKTLCASCHGESAQGGRALALANNRRIGELTDGDLQKIIREGTPNGMPGFSGLTQAELGYLTVFLRSLNKPLPVDVPEGDVAAGEAFFFGKGQCSSCHLALGRGTASGPDLSNIGRQMNASELTRSLTNPSDSIAQGYRTVRVQLKDGTTVRGFVRNEGNHNLPLQSLGGRLIVVWKSVQRACADRHPQCWHACAEVDPLAARLR